MEGLIKRSRELRETEFSCRSMAQERGISVVMIDKEYKIIFCNDCTDSISKVISGVEMEKGHSFFDFVTGRNAEYWRENFDRALQGEAFSEEKKLEVPGGSEHCFSMFFNPVFSEIGNITGMCLAVMDVTEQNQIEVDLKIMENSFRFSSSAIAIFDLNGLITLVNPAFLELWGYSELSEVTGRPVSDFWGVQGDLKETLNPLLEEGELLAEYRAKHKNGSFFYIQVLGSVVLDKDGKPLNLQASSVDITQRKEAERALRKSESCYRFLVENQNDLLIHCDKDWKFVYVSPNYLKTFGKTEEELIGKTNFYLIHKEDREKVKRSLERLRKPPFECRHEERDLTVDGWKWISWSNRAVVDENNEILQVIAVGRDISEQKKAEEDLKIKNEELEALNRKITNHGNFLHALLQSIPVPVFYKDGQCRYLGCNEAFTRITGLTLSEIEGKTAEEIWPKEFSLFYHQKDLELLGNQVEQEFEYQIKGKDEKIHDVIYFKNVFRDDLDQIAGIVGALSEITELKKSEQALKSSEEQFRLLYEKAPIGYHSLDPDGRLLTVNQTWLDTLGYKKEEVIGRSFFEFITEDSGEIFSAGLKRVRDGCNELASEFQLIKREGKIIDASFSGIAIRDTAGNFLKTHCVFIDISANKEILRNLRKVAGQAKGLKGFIPICAGCQRIQDLEQKKKPWVSPAQYISERLPDIRFSHGMCPDCIRKWYPDYEHEDDFVDQ